MRIHLLGSVLPLGLVVALGLARTTTAQQDPGHVMLTPQQIHWQPAPASLPAGAQMAVLDGDPARAGVWYSIGLKMPDGYRLPPHWHPLDASVTVVQGTFGMGVGDTFEPSRGRELTAGSYLRISQGVRHYEWTKGETIIHVHGLGPLETTYVNPADDPRQNRQE